MKKKKRSRIYQPFVPLYRRAIRAVVSIETEEEQDRPALYFMSPEGNELSSGVNRGIGTGFVLHRNGLIATNEHVIQKARTIRVISHDKRTARARMIWADRARDLAVLQVSPSFTRHSLKLGSSGKSQVGEWVMAIGNPIGLSRSLTTGILSAKNRTIQNLDTDSRTSDLIQTDCAIHPGNSGGPLLNMRGEVIGMVAYTAEGRQGISFAIGSDSMKRAIAPLLRKA